MSSWSLKYKGEQKSLAAWRINRCRIQQLNQQVDTFTFYRPLDSITEADPFTEGEIAEVFFGETRRFYGRIEDPQFITDDGKIGLSYTVSSVWWYLVVMGFRQSWKVRPNLTEETLIEQFTSLCLLGSKVTGETQSIRDQIQEAVEYAIGQDAPITFDVEGLPTVTAPLKEVWNAPVAEVIRLMLQWAPDIVTFLDPSTTPPTIRFRRRCVMVGDVKTFPHSVNIPFANTKNHSIRARNDIKVPGVVIYYIKTDTINGDAWTQITEDKFPAETTGREPKALVAAINLTGTRTSYTSAAIQTVPIDPTNPEWWRSKVGELEDASRIRNIVVKPGSLKRVSSLGYEMVGQYASWMGGIAEEDRIEVQLSYEEHDDAGVIRKRSNQPHFVDLIATNLTSKTYVDGSTEPGQIQPSGLAEQMYRASNELHFDGQFSIVGQNCDGSVSVGMTVNITGGRPAWASMNAQVQSVAEDIDSGTTTVTIGPPKLLGFQEIVELLQPTRNRWNFTSVLSRSTGRTGSNSVTLGHKISKQVNSKGGGGKPKETFHDPNYISPSEGGGGGGGESGPPGRAEIDVYQLNGKTVAFRLEKVCIDGVEKQAYIFMSEPF